MTSNRSQSLAMNPVIQSLVFAAGLILWMVHLLVSYGLVQFVCARGWSFLFFIETGLLASASALIGLWSGRAKNRIAEQNRDDPTTSSAHFMMRAGMMSALFFAVVILIQGMPVLFIDPCEWAI